MENKMRVSVIIPCYNEERTIEKVIKSIPQNIFEVIVVDNNSTDKTAEIAKKLKAKVVKEKKQGYGYALRKGFESANGDIIVTLDGDGQYPAEKINELLEYFQKENLDFLNCSRFPLQNKNSMPFLRKCGNFFLTLITNILFGTNIKDSQSGMMIFKKEILKKMNLESGGMPLSQELKIKTILNKFKFGEVNIPYYPRGGESKLNPLKDGIRNFVFLLNLWYQYFPKTIIKIFALSIIIFIFSFLASFNLDKEFINVTSDTNGENGLAVLNWINGGIFNLRFGKYVAGYLEKGKFNFDEIKGKFYTHHPIFYLFPTYFFYKIFGISELTTRAGPFVVFLLGLIIFFFALIKIFNNLKLPLLISLFLVILPGFIYYSTTFELAVFSLPLALITYSFFIFYYFSQKEIYFYSLLASMVLGGLIGWFYFFMPTSIWLFLLIDKNKNFVFQRKKLLIVLPIISLLVFLANIFHFYILNGEKIFKDLVDAFLFRSQRIPFQFWLRDIYNRFELNYTPFFTLFSLLGLIIFFSQFQKYKILLPIILMPFLNTLIFYQWSTHPFGVIFFAPLIAISNGLLIQEFLFRKINKYLAILLTIIFLLIGFYFSLQKLNFLVNQFLILNLNDIKLLQELKPKIDDNELCLGQNQMGLYYGGIVMWYLRKNIFFSPDCLSSQKIKYALIFHPRLGEFSQKEAENFLNNRFKPLGCSGLFCFLVKE